MRDEVYQPATAEAAARYAAAHGVTAAEAAATLARAREAILARIAADPYRYGYEPPIWIVTDALLRGWRPNPQVIAAVRKRTGYGWEEFSERIRRTLGFAHPVGEVLVMGANRSGKTDYAAKRTNEVAQRGNMNLNAAFQTLPTGKQIQEPRVWHYLPKEDKKTVKTPEEYIAYTKQNGFSGSKITFRNGSSLRFITYEMDVNSVLEGSALDWFWPDEEFPKAYLDAGRMRLASKRGVLLATFTPVSGYTSVVADFLDGMRVTKWHTAYMLPRDNKPPLPWLELGLTKDEYERLTAWRDAGGTEDPGIPEARPEDCFEWLLGERDNAPEEARGRAFQRVPRVAVAKGGEAAVIWFFGSDNPYGKPAEVIASAMKNIDAGRMVRMRVYGQADRIKGRLFPEFSRTRNVVPAAEVPPEGVNCMVVDPAPERNWACGWYRYVPRTDVLYKIRDWPDLSPIPGFGALGDWAVRSDRNNGINDGARGPAQDSIGFAFRDYKFEWARLEGWDDYEAWIAAGHKRNERPKGEEWNAVVDEWSDQNGAREVMQFRVVDARAGSQSKITMADNATLFENMEKLASGFQYASGQKIQIGLNLLHDRIATGRYKISDACTNTIFTYETLTGADGQKGACKDFMDLDRYAVLSGITDFASDDPAADPTSASAREHDRRAGFPGIARFPGGRVYGGSGPVRLGPGGHEY